MTVLLQGHGLARDLTGIERTVIAHASWWIGRGYRVRVTADTDATWTSALPAGVEVTAVRRRPAALLRRVPPTVLADVTLVHSFGAILPDGQFPAVYSVYDWGPVRDGALPFRARAVWTAAIVWGLRRADVAHTISARTAATRPRWLRTRAQWRVAAPSGLALLGTAQNLDPPQGGGPVTDNTCVLYVGAVTARKRVQSVVDAVIRSPHLRLVLAGAGTEAWAGRHRRVLALGSVSDERLAGLYADCRAVALVSTYEGFGIPVREALDRGLPAVVSESVAACHPGAPSGRLVVVPEPVEPDALAAALDRAVRMPALSVGAPEATALDDLYAGLL